MRHFILARAPALLAMAGCAGAAPAPTTAQQKAVADDLAAQTDCVNRAKSPAEADACTAAVKARRPNLDGGAP